MEERNDILKKSLDELSRTVDRKLSSHRYISYWSADLLPTANKIFYFQISDGTRMDPPIGPKHPSWDGETPARGLWSHDYRPLPYETDKGAYLPVEGELWRALLIFASDLEALASLHCSRTQDRVQRTFFLRGLLRRRHEERRQGRAL